MNTPPPNPIPWVIRRARPLAGRGPRPRPDLPLGAVSDPEPFAPRRLDLEFGQGHNHFLGGPGWEGLLASPDESGPWAGLLGCSQAVAATILSSGFVETEIRQVVRAQLAVARRLRFARRLGHPLPQK